MKIRQIRNATMIVELGDKRILVDPMLAPKGAIPALKYATFSRRRNPLVELPDDSHAWLNEVTHCLITHCQKGHFDHLDRAGSRWLRERGIPVFCMTGDADFLRSKGLNVQSLQSGTQSFLEGEITPVPCVHGRGIVGSMMAHGFGYLIRYPQEPSLYIAGDTLLTAEVKRCLTEQQPQVSVIPAGGARFDIGGDIIMGQEEALEAARLSQGVVVANHLEALDHCPVTRQSLTLAARRAGILERLHIPRDGEELCFS